MIVLSWEAIKEGDKLCHKRFGHKGYTLVITKTEREALLSNPVNSSNNIEPNDWYTSTEVVNNFTVFS